MKAKRREQPVPPGEIGARKEEQQQQSALSKYCYIITEEMKLFREQYKKKTSSSILINFECGLADGWLSKRNVRVYTKAECAKDH